jgi:hypothetical protein
MSIHHGSAFVPAFDNNARSPSPRASWQSKNSARTWIPSPHKAPLLEPVLTTTPVTRSPSHAGEYTSLEETEHMTIDVGVPDGESILGSRGVLGPKETKETKKGFAGNLLNGLKRLPEVVGVFGTDRKQAYQGDIPKATRPDNPSATTPENGTNVNHDTAELGYVDPPHFRVPVGQQPTSERFQNPLPGITYPYNTRTFDHQGYDWSAAATRPHDVQNYDHRVHHGHPYHLQDPQSQVHYGINGDTYNISGAADYDAANDARTPTVRYLPYPVHHEHIGNSPEAGLHEPVLPFNTAMSPILEAHSNSRSADYTPTIHRPKLKIVIFLKSLYRLPWISSRITADYEPGGRIDDDPPTQVNVGSSWYAPRRYPLDLLSSGESIPTTSVTHRRDRTLMSGTGSSSLQTATPDRHHRSQGGRTSNTRRISLFRRDRGQRGEAQPSAENLGSPTIRGHRLDKPSHGRQRSRTGSHQYSTRRTDKRHKARTTSDLEPPAREHRSYKSPRYPQMVAAIPHVPPPQPLFILTPQSSDQSQAGLRQAVPVYVLTPHSPSLSPQNATDTQEPARKPSPSPHPTPGSSRSHHTPPT